MIQLKELITENEELTLDELALKVDRHHRDVRNALKTLIQLGHGDDKHDIKKMEGELIDFLNNKLYKKYGKDVEIK